MVHIRQKFGSRVRGMRLAQSLTLEQLGERADVHPTYIADVERGERNITLESMEKIARGLGIPLSELFTTFSDNEADDEKEQAIQELFFQIKNREIKDIRFATALLNFLFEWKQQ